MLGLGSGDQDLARHLEGSAIKPGLSRQVRDRNAPPALVDERPEMSELRLAELPVVLDEQQLPVAAEHEREEQTRIGRGRIAPRAQPLGRLAQRLRDRQAGCAVDWPSSRDFSSACRRATSLPRSPFKTPGILLKFSLMR